jgi:hypothetical protein
MKVVKAFLVYQAGIANVFEVSGHHLDPEERDTKRLFQGDFRTAEAFCRGLGAAGCIVRTAACNRAGDISDSLWSNNLAEQPFSNKFRPVTMN